MRHVALKRYPIALLAAILSLTCATAHAQFGVVFSYDGYTKALNKAVDDDGMVDYKGLKDDPEGLDRYLHDASGLYTDTYAGWPNKEKIAFLINTYNALTLRSIIQNYPIKPNWKTRLTFPNGIRQIPGVWKETTHNVMGQNITLDHIEHEMLRKDFNEPRIHMTLVCAAMGCPPLRNEVYLVDKLDGQLDDQSKRFLADPAKFKVDTEQKVVYLSKIFEWFGGDFVKVYGEEDTVDWGSDEEKAVLAFCGEYIEPALWEALKSDTYKVKYLDYDWSLNEQK